MWKEIKKYLKILYLGLADITMCDICDYSDDSLKYINAKRED